MKNFTLQAALGVALFFVFPNFSTAQGGWLELLDFETEDWSQTVLVAPDVDGGYYLAGSRLAKTDARGEVLWARPWPTTDIETGHNGSHHAAFLPNGNIARIGQNGFTSEFVIESYTPGGELDWANTYPDPGVPAEFISMIGTTDDNLLTVGYYFESGCGCYKITLRKINPQGDEIWASELGDFSPDIIIETVVSRSDGQYFLGGSSGNEPILILADESGNLVWQNVLFNSGYASITTISETADGDFLLAGYDAQSGSPDEAIPFVAKYDLDGNEIWTNTYPALLLSVPQDLIVLPSGEIVITGYDAIDVSMGNVILWKLDADGNTTWFRRYDQFLELERAYSVKSIGDEGFIMSGLYRQQGPPPGQDMLLLKADTMGEVDDLVIQGNLFHDEALDCDFSGDENGLSGWIVQAAGNQTFYGVTDEEGNYSLRVEAGNYEVSAVAPRYWTPCVPLPTVQVDMANDTAIVNLPMQPQVDCPQFFVDISAPYLKFCDEGYYTVSYCNRGFISMDDVSVQVTLPEEVEFVDATANLISQSGQEFVFEIGNVDVNGCGSFRIRFNLSCETSDLERTLCAEAHIFPDDICDNTWTGPEISVGGGCSADTVKFEISNAGSPMSEVAEYIVIEDNVILYDGGFQLNSLEGQAFAIPPQNNATYHVIAYQTNGYPRVLGNAVTTASVEGCGGTGVNPGAFGEIAEDDGAAWLSTDCHQVMEGFREKEKKAAPSGWQDENFIMAKTELEYHIRFQNTSDDTIGHVTVIDTISPFLDISTLTPGASSHDYDMEIDELNIVRFIFSDLVLPDSASSPLGSQGFLKYRIAQQPGNPSGTVIRNQTGIQMNYEPYVSPDPIFHTILEPWVEKATPSKSENSKSEFELYPNPTTETAAIVFDKMVFKDGSFQLLNAQGQVVQTSNFSGNRFEIKRNGLPYGLYFFQIFEGEKNMISERLIFR